MEKRTVSLDNLALGEDVTFTPAEYTEDSDGNITIKCSLGNTYTVVFHNTRFIEHFKAIYNEMKGMRYALFCHRDSNNNLDCCVM